MQSTPRRSRNGDMAADFASSLVDVLSGMFVRLCSVCPGFPLAAHATVLKAPCWHELTTAQS
jgi:hypothetical protein